MAEVLTDDQRVVYFVCAGDDVSFYETVQIFSPSLSDTGALLGRLWDGDLKERVILAWGFVVDDEAFDEFMIAVEPARTAGDLYQAEIGTDPNIYIRRAIGFLNGTFTPDDDDDLRYAMIGVNPPSKMAVSGIMHYLRTFRNVVLPMFASKDDIAPTAADNSVPSPK